MLDEEGFKGTAQCPRRARLAPLTRVVHVLSPPKRSNAPVLSHRERVPAGSAAPWERARPRGSWPRSSHPLGAGAGDVPACPAMAQAEPRHSGADSAPTGAGRGEPCLGVLPGSWGRVLGCPTGGFEPSQPRRALRDVSFGDVSTRVTQRVFTLTPGYRPDGLCRSLRTPPGLPTPKPSCRGRDRPQLIPLAVPQGAEGQRSGRIQLQLPPPCPALCPGKGPRGRALPPTSPPALPHVLFHFGACAQTFPDPEGRAGSAEQWSREPGPCGSVCVPQASGAASVPPLRAPPHRRAAPPIPLEDKVTPRGG